MDLLKLKDKYLNALFFKSKNDYTNGFNEVKLCRLINISVEESTNLRNYLTQKGLLEEQRYDNDESIILTADGLDYCLENRANKIVKVIQFTHSKYVAPTGRTASDFVYYYNIIDDNSVDGPKTITVSISWILITSWGYELNDLEKILLQIAKDKISKKLKEGTLNDFEEVMLLSNNSPTVSPYEPKNLPEANEAEYEVEMGKMPLNQEVIENKLAASIIELRDIINAIFYNQNKQKLLLLNEERNLLDFFKPALNEEEYSNRVASLGQISRHINVEILRKLTSETDKNVKSVQLLEKFLTQIGGSNNNICDTLKYLGRIRQGYPIHTDIAGVIEGLKQFNLKYPIEDYENTWQVLLNSYLNALKDLYKIFSEKYLTEQ
jgi:hypothetical protein